MKSPDPILYLTHILEGMELAKSYVQGLDLIEFSESQKLQDAVIRRIEIIGEAVKNLPRELREASHRRSAPASERIQKTRALSNQGVNLPLQGSHLAASYGRFAFR